MYFSVSLDLRQVHAKDDNYNDKYKYMVLVIVVKWIFITTTITIKIKIYDGDKEGYHRDHFQRYLVWMRKR